MDKQELIKKLTSLQDLNNEKRIFSHLDASEVLYLRRSAGVHGVPILTEIQSLIEGRTLPRNTASKQDEIMPLPKEPVIRKTNICEDVGGTFHKSFEKHYGEQGLQHLLACVNQCRYKGQLFGFQELFPEEYNQISALAFKFGVSREEALAKLCRKYFTFNTTYAFVTKQQELFYIETICGSTRKKNIDIIREHPAAFRALYARAKKQNKNVYTYMQEAGYMYSKIAQNLDMLDRLKKYLQKRNGQLVFRSEIEQTDKAINHLLNEAILTQPNLHNELLTEQELIQELGGAYQGQSPKAIYTDEACLQVYKNFIKLQKEKGCTKPYQRLYENLSVAYAVTKLAYVREVTPTALAKFLDKHIDEMKLVVPGIKRPMYALPLRIIEHEGKIKLENRAIHTSGKK